MRILRINKASNVIANVEIWASQPSNTDMEYFITSDTGEIGDAYISGAITPASTELTTFTPAQIVAAFDKMGIASTVLTNTDEVTKARFFTATAIREDAPELIAALTSTGKTIEDLKSNM